MVKSIKICISERIQICVLALRKLMIGCEPHRFSHLNCVWCEFKGGEIPYPSSCYVSIDTRRWLVYAV